MQFITDFLTVVLQFCYSLFLNYGVAIILFTLLSKVVLFPISIWVQKNSIKMVKIQPEINEIKVKYYGDKDTIAEKQAELMKREKYNAFADIIPMIIQIALLIAMIAAIKQGMEKPNLDLSFLGIQLNEIPKEKGGWLYLVPLVAGLTSYALCVVQNKCNVVQENSSKAIKIGTMTFSVGIALFLGFFVQTGVALYWMASNLFAILSAYMLNWMINPRKYLDYERLEKSRQALDKIEQLGNRDIDPKKAKLLLKREKQDYKRFFSVTNKHLVFYSESNGFYKYFKGYIEYLLKNTNLTIHYITSDPDDNIFDMEKKNSKIRGYYIGEKRLITLMMKMDADVVAMTMPDLQNYHIKRSFVRKDIEYIYIGHGVGSWNLLMRHGSTHHYDTIFCTGPSGKIEEEQIEELYGLPKRNLIEVGYPLIDEARAKYSSMTHHTYKLPKILIAPSWQEDNIVDSCLETILDQLKGKGYDITVRPHPQEVRQKKEYMEKLKQIYEPEGIVIQTDFSSDKTWLEADVLITDWSGIGWEYAYTTLKPVLSINTPMKVMNPDYLKIKEIPITIRLREELGKTLDLDQLDRINDTIVYMLNHSEEYSEQINRIVNENLYNLGHSAEVGGAYIVSAIQRKIEEKRNQK